jgi:3-deoxy-D-manno-octulosonic-acid transferase
MYTLYSISLFFLRIAFGFLAIFDPKIRRGITGRKKLFPEIEKYYFGETVGRTLSPTEPPGGLRVRPTTIISSRKRILIHVSSFGELEQAKPVIAALKEQYPDIHIHLTFFSPSGYENAIGSYTIPNIITYLPYDSKADVNHFLNITKPDLVLFVRYDLWHNFVHEVHDRNIPMLLFSATFDTSIKKTLPFVRNLYQKTYSFMNTICTVSATDNISIEQIAVHAKKIIIAGDTRCDQVIARKNTSETEEALLPAEVLQKISSENLKVFLAGSTWRTDEQFLIPTLKKALEAEEKIISIIAPHEVDQAHIADLISAFGTDAILLSAISQYKDERIIIVDSIGKLFSLYRHATFAYVGGGFSSGVHNILEPAVWAVPSIVGPNHQRSKEIAAMIGLGGATEVQNDVQFEDAFHKWLANDMARMLAAVATKEYVYTSQGATEKILKEIIALQW